MSVEGRPRLCVERGCDEIAGGRWSPYWCPKHDTERVERISRRFGEIDRFLTAKTDTGPSKVETGVEKS